VKEIDFLPEWYKSGRQRQVSFRTQVIGLSGLFLIMIAWNFITTYSISKAGAQVEQRKVMQAQAERVSREFTGIKSEVAELQKKVKSMEELDSKIDVAGVLAEMSFLIDHNIVLSQVEFDAERFVGEKRENASKYTDNVARVAVGGNVDKEKMILGDVRFKVVLRGVAADAGDIAVLICRLEESPYFCQVYPSFSRNKKMKAGTEQEFQVSEFEVSCYLANYLEK
jgi:hypothetical protein